MYSILLIISRMEMEASKMQKYFTAFHIVHFVFMSMAQEVKRTLAAAEVVPTSHILES